MSVNGKSIQVTKFSSLTLAKSYAGRKEWIVMGDVSEYLIVRPVDSAKLMAAGHELVRELEVVMSKPSRFFVTKYTVDPAGEGPDSEEYTSVATKAKALSLAKKLRKHGELAFAFERTNIHLSEDTCKLSGYRHNDLIPAHLWERTDVRIKEDEAAEDAEYEARK